MKYFRVGDHNINVTEEEEAEYEIKSIEVHPDFNVGPYLNNDIAIVTIGNNTNAGLEENENNFCGRLLLFFSAIVIIFICNISSSES